MKRKMLTIASGLMLLSGSFILPAVSKFANNLHSANNLKDTNNVIKDNFATNLMNTSYSSLTNIQKLNFANEIYYTMLYFLGVITVHENSSTNPTDIKAFFTSKLDAFYNSADGKFNPVAPTTDMTDPTTSKSNSTSMELFLFSTGTAVSSSTKEGFSGKKLSLFAQVALNMGWTYDTNGTLGFSGVASNITIMDVVNGIMATLIRDYIGPSSLYVGKGNNSMIGFLINTMIQKIYGDSTNTFAILNTGLFYTFLPFLNYIPATSKENFSAQTANSEITASGSISSGSQDAGLSQCGSLLIYTIVATMPNALSTTADYNNLATNLNLIYIKNTIGNFLYDQNIMTLNYYNQTSGFQNPQDSLNNMVFNMSVMPQSTGLNAGASGQYNSNFSPIIFTKDNISNFDKVSCPWDLYTQTIFQQGVNKDLSNITFNQPLSVGFQKYNLQDWILQPNIKNNFFANNGSINASYNTVISNYNSIVNLTPNWTSDTFSNAYNQFLASDISYWHLLITTTSKAVQNNPKIKNPIFIQQQISNTLNDKELTKYFDIVGNGGVQGEQFVKNFNIVLKEVFGLKEGMPSWQIALIVIASFVGVAGMVFIAGLVYSKKTGIPFRKILSKK